MSRFGTKKPARLGEVVTGLMSPIVARRAAMSSELLAAWPELAGPGYAHTTRPERIRWPRRIGDEDPFEPGVLVVACDGGSAIRLQHEAGLIVERINVFLGFPAIARLKIVQKPVRRVSSGQARRYPQLGPGERMQLKKMLENVGDPELRTRLERLGRGVFSRAKAGK